MAKANFGGIVKKVCLEYTPEIVPGDYVLVHVGFALSKVDEEEAERTYRDPARDEPTGRIGGRRDLKPAASAAPRNGGARMKYLDEYRQTSAGRGDWPRKSSAR